MVEINNKKYLDGGITDSIPIKKSIKDNHEKNVVILTRDSNYRKGKPKFLFIMKLKYKKYPNLIKAIANRYKVYNETLDFIEEKRKEGKEGKRKASARTKGSHQKGDDCAGCILCNIDCCDYLFK